SVPPAPGAEAYADVTLERLTELDPDAIPARREPPHSRTERADHLEADRTVGPADTIHPVRRTVRTWISRSVAWVLARALFRPSLEDRGRLPAGPAIYCFNHLNWIDPFVLMATLPMRPRLLFFGPKEEDMTVGGRNRLMHWTGATIPYRPGKNDLLEATRKVHAAIASGHVVAIAGERRI